MDINRQNYQEYFLDYYENSLQPQKVAELMVFLEVNPDLNEEFEAFESISLEPSSISYSHKKKLKKPEYIAVGQINALNYEEWMISGMEKTLSPLGVKNLEQFISKNPESRLEYNMFLQSRLLPENEVQYQGKDELKKRGVIFIHRALMYRVASVAAILILLFTVFLSNEYFSSENQIRKARLLDRVDHLSPVIVFSSAGPVVKPRSDYQNQIKPLDNTTNYGMNEPKQLQALEKLIAINVDVIPSPDYDMPSIEPITIDYHAPASSENEALALEPAQQNRDGSFASRFVNGVLKNIFGQRNRSGKTFLEYTVDGYNLMADKDVEVEKEYNSSGEIVAYRVNGEVVKIGRKVNAPLGE